MPETVGDPAIKLFGKTIAVPAADGCDGGGDEHKGHQKKESAMANTDTEQESPNSEEKSEPISPSADDNQKHASDDQETTQPDKDSSPEEERNVNESSDPREKTLKKPDKILPCPRCNSLETKFCYYNNYNVNQPRHFCKNCQRYWTAGGTMRNVPVGAGRRKNKNSIAAQYRHLTVSGVNLQAIPDPIHNPPLKPNGTVLSFGSDAPLCDSVASVLNLAEKTIKNYHRTNERTEEQSSVASVTPSSEGVGASVNCQGFAQFSYPNGSPWPFPWNPPPICAPVPFYPAATYWGCAPWSMPALPWLPPLATPSPTSGLSGQGPTSPSLGKRSREAEVSNKGDGINDQSNQEKSRLWIPKTLRIHDPEEAAKSSVWATLGLKSDKTDGGRGFFKDFRTKGELSRTHLGEASQALHANPAALSRSINFQERT